LAVQARAQVDASSAAHQAQLLAQKAQNEAIHLQVKTQSEIALAKVKADLDARLSLLDAHLKAATDTAKAPRSIPPGARKARDGQHYVPDPQRPGKFLLVVHHA
jgi:hypothetical protein